MQRKSVTPIFFAGELQKTYAPYHIRANSTVKHNRWTWWHWKGIFGPAKIGKIGTLMCQSLLITLIHRLPFFFIQNARIISQGREPELLASTPTVFMIKVLKSFCSCQKLGCSGPGNESIADEKSRKLVYKRHQQFCPREFPFRSSFMDWTCLSNDPEFWCVVITRGTLKALKNWIFGTKNRQAKQCYRPPKSQL